MEHISLYLDHLMEIAAEDTMFIITGDHGMREDGNHGGNSAVERESLMFAYYKPKEGEDK
jgi:phosphatidylinositol glycan class O